MLYGLSTFNSGKFCYLTNPLDYYQINTIKCELCGEKIQEIHLKFWPPKLILEGGKKYPDLLNIVTPFENKTGIILSENALKAFQHEQISGFFFEPISILTNTKNTQNEIVSRMHNYYYCYVTGSVSLDYSAMHYRKKNICLKCGHFTWSRQKIGESFLDYSTWDKSDICKIVDYPNMFVCTQKVIDVIKQYNLKGFSIADQKDIFLPLKYNKI